MTVSSQLRDEDDLIQRSVQRLNAIASGLGLGVLCGLGLFVATLWLVWRDGPWVGEHLGLLSQYFPGYSVSVGGSFLGFVYAFVVGGAAGYVVASLYNRLAR